MLDLLTEVATGHPGRERLAALIIRALHTTGRRDQAITVYQRTRAHLTDHLGVDPTDALDDAYRDVLHGQATAPVPDGDRRRLAQLPAGTGKFTGRNAELARLLTLILDTAIEPGPGAVVTICAVDGMGGIGKLDARNLTHIFLGARPRAKGYPRCSLTTLDRVAATAPLH